MKNPVNNFDIIRDEVLRFNDKGQHPTLFYTVEIIRRKKDPGNENFSKNEEFLDCFMIYSKEDLDKYKDKIIDKCLEYNARAYINVNASREVDFLKALVEYYGNALVNAYEKPGSVNFRSADYVWRRCVNIVDDDKYFMIDCDTEDLNIVSEVRNILTSVRGASATKGKDGQGEDKVVACIPTLNGYHLVVRHFDTAAYAEAVKVLGVDAECKKHALTLLYANVG